ncbi:uncharacterized protein LOC121808064 [Salvia splendens]|uniref:uncharacterized protein LOC121808064 n=1 Tax=Salvia splendens TaxID=180675 RepID=UPI001C2629C0|nr:uncharacterized protein LOC121808064 [Salvia splendens]
MAPKRKCAGSSGGSSSQKSSCRNREPTRPPSPPHWRPSPPHWRPSPRHAPVVIDVEEETWDIRDPDLDFFVPEDEYRDAPGKFSVAFHYGGSFFNTNDDNKYVGEKLTYFDFCNINHFALIDLSSMVLKLKYDRKMICEFYYCNPKYSNACAGVSIGGSLLPIVEDTHLTDFLKVASMTTKLVHIYVVEITRANALLKKMKDEAQELLRFRAAKPPGVIIEEIEETEPSVPKQKPRPMRRQRNKPLMIGWYDRDIEFEEYLTKSLDDNRAKRKRDAEVASQNLANAFEAVSTESVPTEAPTSEIGEAFVAAPDIECTTEVGGGCFEEVGDVGGGESHAHVPEDVARPSSVDHSIPIGPSVDEPATEPEGLVHQPDSERAGASTDEDVYRPVMDGGCQSQPDIRVDNDIFPIIEDITHELFMSEADTQVHESAPAAAACEEPVPVVEDVPHQVAEDVYCPSFDYVPDGCHLHNEGSIEEDGSDDEVDHFISLANMCRDEQMFTSYYESLCRQQHSK